MSDWNSKQYLKFEDQRTQPAIDLANSIGTATPNTVLDLGCGPGNSTAVLKRIFRDSVITGVDNSPEMIAKAKSKYPDTEFVRSDIRDLDGKYDLLFSNACLQWVPDHEHLIPHLIEKNLNDDGVLAVQIPMNGEEPLFKIIKEVTAESKWGFPEKQVHNGTLTPIEYFEILGNCSDSFRIWETVYYHNLADHNALIEWVKGARLRPYLAQLDETKGKEFEDEILEKAKAVYKPTKSGEVILKFRRFFFTAVK